MPTWAAIPARWCWHAIHDAEQRAGRKMILILTPSFNLLPGGDPKNEPEPVLDHYQAIGTTFCFPHQCVTDALVDKRAGVIRDLDHYTKLIRERGMIPGLSTHMPESVIYADRQGADVESYIQIFNAAGFLMQVEPDWVLNVIQQAKKPVMTIKPLAAGRLLPIVGLSFVWSTLRPQDMVTIGTTTPAEAKEVINISLDLLHHRPPMTELQITRSKSIAPDLLTLVLFVCIGKLAGSGGVSRSGNAGHVDSLRPPRPVLDRLGDVRRLNRVGSGQVGDGACQLEDAVIRTGAELHLAHGRAQQLPAGLVHGAVVAHLGGSHVGVGGQDRAWRHCLAKRAVWRARAASTRARMAADDSPRRSSDSFWKGTRGTSTWMSIRSSSGPERRFW